MPPASAAPSSRVKLFNRKDAMKVIREMCDELEEDHEEQTGVSDVDEMPMDEWIAELRALFDNTR